MRDPPPPPPQLRYSGTWVILYFVSRGANQNLSINDLTCITVMPMALTRPSRSADLVNPTGNLALKVLHANKVG